MTSAAIPSGFLCPITHEVMKDPVTCSDGFSYERNAIMRWLSDHNTSPMTNMLMDTVFYPNLSLRTSIQDYFQSINNNTQSIISMNNIPNANITVSKFNETVCLTCEDIKQKNPVDFVFAIDNSGSMGESAGIQGDIETQCYSRLDLVKHAALCIIESLDENDYLGIVVYSTHADIILQRCKMTSYNKNVAIDLVKDIRVAGSTNLWEGLMTSLNMTRDSDHASPGVLLFTDGQPTAGTQQVDNAFSRFIANNKLDSHVYTFGFSNCVNSTLLNALAELGNGQFHFISDSAMIFTVIVNFLANYYTMYGDIIVNNENYGPIYYGQTKYINVHSNTQSLDIKAINNTIQTLSLPNAQNAFIVGECLYNAYITIKNTIIDANMHNFNEAKSKLESFVNTLYQHTSEDIIQALIENICDQIYLAISQMYYHKWGKHYIYSFLNALRNQINNNFKDIVVQKFGGSMFNTLQDNINEIIANVPPPPPSLTYHGESYTVHSMSSFNDSSNPCFEGFNKVKMADSTFKYVKDIVRGDEVFTPMGKATVCLVVKTICRNYMTDLCKIDKLVVTPWHPIKYNHKWCFPNEISPSTKTQCDAVYCFVLDKHHIMNIEDFDVICLAHGYNESILAHNFWGTQNVIDSLKTKPGYEDGLVVLQSGCLIKDSNTGLVCAL